MVEVFVHVEPAHAQGLCSCDLSVPGVYAVLLDNAPAGLLMDAALDGFHTHVPVRVLEDFSFTVRTALGVILTDDAGSVEAYTLEQFVVSVRKL